MSSFVPMLALAIYASVMVRRFNVDCMRAADDLVIHVLQRLSGEQDDELGPSEEPLVRQAPLPVARIVRR